MKKTGVFVSLAFLLGAASIIQRASLPLPNNPVSAWKIPKISRQRLGATYARLPLSFEANQGQTDGSVKFLARGDGYTLFLTSTEAVLSLASPDPRRNRHSAYAHGPERQSKGEGAGTHPASDQPSTVLRMKLGGANPNPAAMGVDELPGKGHYFLDNDPSEWRTNVPIYAKVRYQDVYPGIDLVYYGNQTELEYDFVVAPGADPSAIRFSLKGQRRLAVDAAGDLLLETVGGGEVRFHRPLIYQESDGVRELIAGSFALHGNDEISFALAAYDVDKPLVIDPVLSYSTYFGGAATDIAYAVAVDSSGNVYIAGETASANFPTATPLQGTLGGGVDTFVAKLNPAGSALLYSTYLGGSLDDTAFGIAVDASGTVFLAGGTKSTNFPLQNALQSAYAGGPSDGFVARLNASGSALIFSTYLGGSGDDVARAVALDSSGSAYVTGQTDSATFPTTAEAYDRSVASLDAFVTKLNPTGSILLYSTYLGGSRTEIGYGIAVDSSGSAYIAGVNIEGSLPTRNPFQISPGGGTCVNSPCPDGFVAKLNAVGTALVYSTYLGGSNADEAFGVAVDSSGSAHVTGYTRSSDFPATDDALQEEKSTASDAFVTKLTASGSELVYSTFMGAGGQDRGWAIAVGPAGDAFIAGQTASNAFPLLNPIQSDWTGSTDAMVAVLSPAGALIFSTYLGGDASDIGRAIAVDSAGSIYAAGGTVSNDFPTANPFQSAFGGGICGTAPNTFPCDDAFVVKIAEVGTTLSSLSPSNAVAGEAGFTLTVNGTDFTSSSIVRWNGANRTTTFVNATQLTSSILGSDIASPGTAQITVSTSGAISNPLPFTITSPGPVPAFTAANLVSAASFNLTGAPPAVASIAALFGANLASSTAAATTLPLPATLGGATVRLNNIAAPLFAASPGQINFQIPWELLGQTQVSMTVAVGGLTSIPVNVNLSALAPGIFTTNAQGTLQGAILIAATGEVAAPVGSIPGRASRPAVRGQDFITIYCTGLGDVTNRPASGAGAGSNPPSSTTATPSVAIGGIPVTPSFSGLVPSLVGLYQINVLVPANAPTGGAVPVVVTIGGAVSNTASIAVQ